MSEQKFYEQLIELNRQAAKLPRYMDIRWQILAEKIETVLNEIDIHRAKARANADELLKIPEKL